VASDRAALTPIFRLAAENMERHLTPEIHACGINQTQSGPGAVAWEGSRRWLRRESD
jgi:hypothetical protein